MPGTLPCPEDSTVKCDWASLIAQLVKNPPAMQETPLQFLRWEDPLEKGEASLVAQLVKDPPAD